MSGIKIKFKIKYENKLTEKEKFSVLYCYLDDTFKNNKLVSIDTKNANKTYDLNGPFPLGNKLPSDCKLVFQAYSTTYNDFDAPCEVDAGLSFIYLKDMEKNKDYELPLIFANANNLEKGKVTLSVEHFHQPFQYKKKHIGDKYSNNYIETFMKVENSFGNTIPNTSDFRCPYYYGQVGMIGQPVPLPAFTFTLSKSPKTNLNFWKNIMKVVSERDHNNHLPTNVNKMDIKQMARLMAEVVVYPVQYMDYIGDSIYYKNFGSNKVNKEGTEAFGDALRTLSGDCEDLAKAIMSMLNSFIEYDFPKEEIALRKLQHIGKQYIPLMSLDIVTAGKVADGSEQNNYGGHMNVNMFPISFVKANLSESQRSTHQHVFGPYDKTINHKLPVLILEGTGQYEPLGFKDIYEKEHNFIYGTIESLKPFKKPILHEENVKSPFFVSSLIGFTDYFYNMGHNYGGVWYLYDNDNNNNNIQKNSRGVSFIDIEKKSSKIKFQIHPKFSQKLVGQMVSASKMRIHPQDFILDNKTNHPKTNDLLERLKANFPPKYQLAGTIKPVSIYMRDYQLKESHITNIINELNQYKQYIHHVDYKIEEISNIMYGYRTTIYIID